MEEPFPALLSRLSANVRARRKTLGLSQERLALEAGVDRTYVSQIERCVGNPSLLVLQKLALTLGTSVSTLLR